MMRKIRVVRGDMLPACQPIRVDQAGKLAACGHEKKPR